jgi:hypothetical protein
VDWTEEAWTSSELGFKRERSLLKGTIIIHVMREKDWFTLNRKPNEKRDWPGHCCTKISWAYVQWSEK